MVFVVRYPFGHRGAEQFAAELIAGEPNDLERGAQHARIVNGFRAGPLSVNRSAEGTIQQPEGTLAMIATGGAKLVKDALFVATTGALITAVNAGQGLAFGRQTHVR